MDTQKLNTYKVVLLGDGYSGKTTLVLRLINGEFRTKYVATMGVEVHPFRFQVCSGTTKEVQRICFNLWDTAGQEKYGGLREGYYIGADAAIVCTPAGSDPYQRMTSISRWVADFRRVCPRAPIILVTTKLDEHTNTTTAVQRGVQRHIRTSSRTCYCIYDPFLAIAKLLLKAETLYLGENPEQVPETTLSLEALKEYEAQLPLYVE